MNKAPRYMKEYANYIVKSCYENLSRDYITMNGLNRHRMRKKL